VRPRNRKKMAAMLMRRMRDANVPKLLDQISTNGKCRTGS